MKKLIVFILIMAAIVMPLMAMGGGEETSKTSAKGATPTLNPDGTFHLPITDKPTTFSIFLNFNNMPFDSNWKTWKKVAENTNISFSNVISQSNSNETEAFNLMLSSGNLADVIGYVSASELEKLGRDGGLIPLNDLIREYAPHIQAMLDSDSRFKAYATSMDGNIYFVPKNQALKPAEYWWIRTDWLKKLGLEMPTTVDELYEVLTAFRNNDPNGNGIKDEIPIFDRAGWKMPDEYLYLWDTSLEFYVDENGKIIYEPMEENFKTGVRNMVKWYKEGLIDPEIFTRGPKSRDILFASNNGGLTHDWVSTADYNTKLQKDVPGFEISVMAPPADQNGVVKERTERFPGVGWGISSSCKDPISVIKLFDYLFTEEGSALMNWGIEGESYYVDAQGEKHFSDAVLNGTQTPTGYLRSIGSIYRVGMNQDGGYEIASMNEYGYEAFDLYNDHPEWFRTDVPAYADGKLEIKYYPEDETQYQRIMGSITPYVKEKFQSWILGTSDFDADYDTFIAELKKRKINEAIAINQRAYDFYISSGK